MNHPFPPFLSTQALATPVVWALALCCGVMVALWILHRPLRNAAIVDVGWAALLGAVGVGYAVLGTGAPGRRWMVGVLVGVWSLRLTTHLLRERIFEQEEEGRYRRLRELWGERATLYFLPFFLGQGLLVVLLSTPFFLAANAKAEFPGVWDVAALVLWSVAVFLEALADRQLARFRRVPANRGTTCREGLWAWSRHPNYFFEWLIWCAFALPGLASPWGALGLLSPVLMLVFVVKVTGIPPTEAQAVRTRGDDYRRYQETTSAFVPWPPRKEMTT